MSKIAVLDIMIVLLIVGGSLNGLRVGALRQLGNLLVFYMSLILTTRFYRLLLPTAKRLLAGAPSAIMEGVLFSLLLVLVYALLGILLLGIALKRKPDRGKKRVNWKRLDRLPGQSLASTLNHLAGLVLGFVTISLWIGIGLLVYRFVIGSSWLDWEKYRIALQADYAKSVLLGVFSSFLPVVIGTLEPWFPNGLPTLFLFTR